MISFVFSRVVSLQNSNVYSFFLVHQPLQPWGCFRMRMLECISRKVIGQPIGNFSEAVIWNVTCFKNTSGIQLAETRNRISQRRSHAFAIRAIAEHLLVCVELQQSCVNLVTVPRSVDSTKPSWVCSTPFIDHIHHLCACEVIHAQD